MNARAIPRLHGGGLARPGRGTLSGGPSPTGLGHGADSVLPALPMQCICSDDGCCWSATIFCCCRARAGRFCTRL